MVVVDSSALIPLSKVGRLDLIRVTFDEIHTTEDVRLEVLTEGQPGVVALNRFLEKATIHDTPPEASTVARLEGIDVADAAVILLAEELGDRLLANDKGLLSVARSHDVDGWWVTTLLLSCTKRGNLSAEDASVVLYNLVASGIYLKPDVYATVQRRLEEFDTP